MYLNFQKEQFSRAYVEAIAASAGCNTMKPDVDDDSIDLCLKSKINGSVSSRPQLDLQLKATKDLEDDGNCFKYTAKVKNYNDLRLTNLLVPRILVVVLVPENVDDWLVQSEEQLVMKKCGYWVSLYGQGETRNETTINIKIPKVNIFSVSVLTEFMQNIASRGSI